MMQLTERIEAVRRFSRFYTRRLGILDEGLLSSPYPLPVARLIYEIAHHDGTTASALAADLGLDPGYVSRLIAQLHRRGLLRKVRSDTDGRVMFLTLTSKGQVEFSKLDLASREQVDNLLGSVVEPDQQQLVRAMATIEQLLGESRGPKEPYILRPHQVGDMGWVVARHGVLYNLEYGWDEHFEGLVAGIVARFLERFDPKRERCWIAERNGENVGTVFLVKKTKATAQLRLLLVEPSARGLGIGKRLVAECTRFARQVGYRKIMLWTNDVLVAARRLYQAEGYELVREEPHHSFGHDLVGQFWELKL